MTPIAHIASAIVGRARRLAPLIVLVSWCLIPALAAKPPAVPLPDRPASAPVGSAFADQIKSLAPADREKRIGEEILKGNVPAHLRTFAEAAYTAADAGGKPHKVVLSVLPDYLAVGADDDFLRIPMTPQTAQAIADKLGCLLTTRKMTDEIYQAAKVKLKPQPMTQAREAVASFLEHQRMIEEQRKGKPAGELTAGHKKDVVITNRLKEKPGKVAIYGWHQPDGKAIQPLTTVHGDFYVDYSHGIRLVRETMQIDGKERKVADILKDPALAPLLSDEGVIAEPRYR